MQYVAPHEHRPESAQGTAQLTRRTCANVPRTDLPRQRHLIEQRVFAPPAQASIVGTLEHREASA
jgi:hypothetical protein